ncbi:tRNA lysidine(34) synthetase TilS [Eupransor demetentiae]|uniref:tRNA(Ile)-lysidine synthase n=1 Tax=Eupransor demetentiae TaxID=3109584 RepID=A0ABM9N5Y0_9LACO|nr:tRNA(Ile)-lysidine synthase TilS/MesJ (TilS) [Lactobacillaceae bacterium LMG 33000]
MKTMSKIQAALAAINWPDNLILAVSGGVDSTVLLHAFKQFRPQQALTVAHVNYHLRPESDGDAAFVEELAQQHGYPFVQKDCHLTGTGIEEKARDLRYAFFHELAQQYRSAGIVLAHQADDQAETILLKLIRGGDLASMTGMAQQDGLLYRPFLGISRAEIATYAQEEGLAWREDWTNHDPEYTARNRVRLQILPALDELNSRTSQHLNQFGQELDHKLDLLKQQAELYLPQFQTDYQQVPEAWWPEVSRLLIQKAGLYKIKKEQLNQISDLLHNRQKAQGEIDLGQAWRFVKNYHQVGIKNAKNFAKRAEERPSIVLELDQWQFFANNWVKWTQKPPEPGFDTLALPSSNDFKGLRLRYGRPQDRLNLKQGHKSLRRLWIDEKFSNDARRSTWVLANSCTDDLLAVRLSEKRWRFNQNFTTDSITKPSWLVWRIEEKPSE